MTIHVEALDVSGAVVKDYEVFKLLEKPMVVPNK